MESPTRHPRPHRRPLPSLLIALLTASATATDLGKAMDLEYGKRGLPEMELGDRRPTANSPAVYRGHLITDTSRKKNLTIPDIAKNPAKYYNRSVQLQAQLKLPEKPDVDTKWRTKFSGTEVVLSPEAITYARKAQSAAIRPVYQATIRRTAKGYYIQLEKGLNFKR